MTGPYLESGPCVIISNGRDRLGVLVDDIEDELEVVIKPNPALLKRVSNVSGATILGTGAVCTVLDPPDLIHTAHTMGTVSTFMQDETDPPPEHDVTNSRHVLLVEDSITTRTQEKRILESAGYLVTIAVDGMDGWNKLSERMFDAVVSDVEMPNLNGLDLTKRIRGADKFKKMPVILVTSLSTDEDRRKGLEVGANAYISKPGFDQSMLLDTLERLI